MNSAASSAPTPIRTGFTLLKIASWLISPRSRGSGSEDWSIFLALGFSSAADAPDDPPADEPPDPEAPDSITGCAIEPDPVVGVAIEPDAAPAGAPPGVTVPPEAAAEDADGAEAVPLSSTVAVAVGPAAASVAPSS